MERYLKFLNRNSIFKMLILPKVIYIFNITPIQIPAAFFFQKIHSLNSYQIAIWITKTFLKKNKSGGLSVQNSAPEFKA